MNKLILFILFFIISFQMAGEETTTLLTFNRTSWNIGVESFSGSLPGRYEYLKNSIPDLIRTGLLSADVHMLSYSEISRYRNKIIETEKSRLIGELSTSYKAKDELIFKDKISDGELKAITDKISLLKDKLMEVNFLDPSRIETAQILPVNWISSSSDNDFMEPDQYKPAVVCESNDLDFLISGTIKEIEDYFLLNVYGFDPASGKKISIYNGTGSIDEIESMASDSADEFRSIILGRAWAGLYVETDNPDSLIYSNGELIGVGSAEVQTMVPGPVLLEAIGEDHSYWSREAELTALEKNVFSGNLSQADISLLSLKTEPSEANVYIGARWAGRTPLSLPRYQQRNIWVTVRSDGYYEKSFEISPESPDEVLITLEEEDMTRLELFELRKKEFYRALGWFSLSAAGPVVMVGVYGNFASRQNGYAYEYNQTKNPDYFDLANEMEQNYNISRGVFFGTLGISGGLLVNVFVKLSRYIKAAEALAE